MSTSPYHLALGAGLSMVLAACTTAVEPAKAPASSTSDHSHAGDGRHTTKPAGIAVCTGRMSDRRVFVRRHAKYCLIDDESGRHVEARLFDGEGDTVARTVIIATELQRIERSDNLLHYEFALNADGLGLYEDQGAAVEEATMELWLAPRFSIREEGALRQHYIGRAIVRRVPLGARDQQPPTLYDGLHFYSANREGMPHWGYHGEIAADHWGDLSGANEACNLDRQQPLQSPIPITPSETLGCGAHEGELAQINYRPGHVALVNNGHTVMASFSGEAELTDRDTASYIKLGDKRFDLLQFHVHVPAEHVVVDERGQRHVPAGEIHFVHRAEDGQLAVLSLLLESSTATHDPLKYILDEFPTQLNEPVELSKLFDPETLIHHARASQVYRYTGSLTTPPCSENVLWVVFQQHLDVTAETIDGAAKLIGGPNARRVSEHPHEVPPVNGRAVLICTPPHVGKM